MTARTMTVTVHLDARLWWRLSGVAEQQGITVGQLLANRAEQQPRGRPKGSQDASTRDRVGALHGKGATDRDIAEQLVLSKATVRYHRLKLGVKANPVR